MGGGKWEMGCACGWGKCANCANVRGWSGLAEACGLRFGGCRCCGHGVSCGRRLCVSSWVSKDLDPHPHASRCPSRSHHAPSCGNALARHAPSWCQHRPGIHRPRCHHRRGLIHPPVSSCARRRSISAQPRAHRGLPVQPVSAPPSLHRVISSLSRNLGVPNSTGVRAQRTSRVRRVLRQLGSPRSLTLGVK